MFSDYRRKERVGYAENYSSISEIKDFRALYKSIKEKYKDIEFTLHKIETDSIGLSSIPEYDSFFDGVVLYGKKDKEKFIDRVAQKSIVTPVDLAKYLLTKKRMSKLKVMKLVYFIYAEYGVRTKKVLFKEPVNAWTYGPVFRSIFDEFDKQSKKDILLESIEMNKVSIQRGIIENNNKLLESIEYILKLYGEKSANTLVDIAHGEGTPWSEIEKSGRMGCEISFEKTINYYSNEFAKV